MNARASENYLAISRSSKSVEIFWAEICWGRFFLGPNLVSFNRSVGKITNDLELPQISGQSDRRTWGVAILIYVCFQNELSFLARAFILQARAVYYGLVKSSK
jgi:hypothetical protein